MDLRGQVKMNHLFMCVSSKFPYFWKFRFVYDFAPFPDELPLSQNRKQKHVKRDNFSDTFFNESTNSILGTFFIDATGHPHTLFFQGKNVLQFLSIKKRGFLVICSRIFIGLPFLMVNPNSFHPLPSSWPKS